MEKINVVGAGGPCTGKSVTAAALFAKLKMMGYDYDLVTEESRRLRKELGHFRSPFERFYMWRRQNWEELRSSAINGFVSDSPLFHLYTQAKLYASEPRDNLAVRELFKMCLEIEDRYQVIFVAKNPCEIPYKTDQSRCINEERARLKHKLVVSFLEHCWPEKVVYVEGSVEERVEQILERMDVLRKR